MKNTPYTKKKIKNPIYELYNNLTKYLMEPSDELLNKLLKNKEDGDKLKNRAILQLEAFPNIIYIINKYLNNKYNKLLYQFTNEQYLECFSQLIKKLNLSSGRLFYFPKFITNQYAEFSKKLKKYNDQIDGDLISNQELQALYLLYKEGIIPNDIFDDLIIDNSDSVKEKNKQKNNEKLIKTIQFNNISFNNKSSKNRTFDVLDNNIKEYIATCKQYINKTHKGCKYCQLSKEPKIILDTNINIISQDNPIDILFIGQHPNRDDIDAQLPMIGSNSSIIRDLLDAIINKNQNIKWACINQIVCPPLEPKFAGDKDFKVDKCILNCRVIFDILVSNLNSKLIILLGDKVAKSLNIKDYKTKIGELIDNRIIILPNPNNLGTPKNKSNFEKGIQTIFSTLEKNKIENLTNLNISKSNNPFNIDPDLIVNKITNDYTILDVKTFKNKLIYILKDKNNIKRYYFEDFNIPVYIKYGQYKQCNYFTEEVDAVCYVTSDEMEQLNRKLYSNKAKWTKY